MLLSMIYFNSKAAPTNDTNYSYCTIIKVAARLTNHVGFISHHITPLVINSFKGRYTHAHTYMHACTHTHMHTDFLHKAILRKQPCAGAMPGLKSGSFIY